MSEDNGAAPAAETVATPAPGADANAGAQGGAGESTTTEAETASTDAEAGDTFVDDGSEPAVNQRKTKKDYIIARKNAKIAKLAAQQARENADIDAEPEESESSSEGAEDAEADEENPLEALTPIVDEHIATQDAHEVTEFLKEHPDLGIYAEKVEKWMKHPSRRNLPVKAIFAEVAFDHLMKLGADRARKADAEAKETQAGGGGSNRDAVSPIDWKTATKEQVAAEQLRVRQGR